MYQHIKAWLEISCISQPADPICVSVGICEQYQACPKKSHLTMVKRIIKYVNETSDYGIFYSKDNDDNVVGFCDSDWTSRIKNQKAPMLDACYPIVNYS